MHELSHQETIKPLEIPQELLNRAITRHGPEIAAVVISVVNFNNFDSLSQGTHPMEVVAKQIGGWALGIVAASLLERKLRNDQGLEQQSLTRSIVGPLLLTVITGLNLYTNWAIPKAVGEAIEVHGGQLLARAGGGWETVWAGAGNLVQSVGTGIASGVTSAAEYAQHHPESAVINVGRLGAILGTLFLGKRVGIGPTKISQARNTVSKGTTAVVSGVSNKLSSGAEKLSSAGEKVGNAYNVSVQKLQQLNSFRKRIEFRSPVAITPPVSSAETVAPAS